MDHPLLRWRLQQGIGQIDLAFRCGVSQKTLSAWELYQRVPQGEVLATLLALTGLPAEAIMDPATFLTAHPDLLGGPPPPQPARGRPKHTPPHA